MFKYKKILLKLITSIFIFLTCVETLIYILSKNNLFGLIYIIMNLIIVFLLVPVTYNYSRYYSSARISKLIIIIILGFFSSYLLKPIVINNMDYIDYSKEYSNKIFAIKNVIKLLIYLTIIIFTTMEFKLDKLLNKKTSKAMMTKK